MITIKSNRNKSSLEKLISIENASLNASLDSQRVLSKQILLFLKNFIGNIEIDSIFSDEINDFIANATANLKKVNENIAMYEKLLEILKEISFNSSSLTNQAIFKKITEYNKVYTTSLNKINENNLKIQEFVQTMPTIDISEYISLDDLDKITNPNDGQTIDGIPVKEIKTPVPQKKCKQFVEDTLIISETDGLVTLPYKISELKKILKKEPDKYSSLSDVVLSIYTKPMRNYKYSSIARFKEAYKLMIEREHSSKKEAFKLALELLSNYNLHPAIITACKNLNELDVYLSCLEYNELEDFHFFKIVYEALPTVVKKNKEALNN